MKRLIVTGSFILLLIASCDSPITNSNTKQSSIQSKSNQLNVAVPAIPYSKKPVKPDSIRQAIWQQFKNQNGSKWRVRWNAHTGLPASVFMGRKKNYRGPAEEAARAFLEDYQALFGFSNIKQLKYVKTQTYRGIRYVTFNQTVHGVPVYEAE